MNLLNNAIDAIRNTTAPWIKIELFEEQQQVVLRVLDSADGIPAAVEEKIFQPFFTTKPVGEGTGLGLSISKGILDQHGASIALNREVRGSCFEIRFPKGSAT